MNLGSIALEPYFILYLYIYMYIYNHIYITILYIYMYVCMYVLLVYLFLVALDEVFSICSELGLLSSCSARLLIAVSSLAQEHRF